MHADTIEPEQALEALDTLRDMAALPHARIRGEATLQRYIIQTSHAGRTVSDLCRGVREGYGGPAATLAG